MKVILQKEYQKLKNMSSRKVWRKRNKHSSLEQSLLDEEELAVLKELDPFLKDESENKRGSSSVGCLHRTRLVCGDKGVISVLITFIISVIGVVLLVVARSVGDDSEESGVDLTWLDEVSRYIISAGLFGFASGGTNGLAVLMLLYKIPLLCGSGVFYKRHKQIRNVIKIIVVQLLLDTEHLESYITRRIKQFSSNVNIVDNITEALNSPETDRIIDSRLDVLYSQPESYYIEALGLKRDQLRPLIKPSIISLCAESAPFVLDTVTEQKDEAISIPRFREEMDRYLSWRMDELTEKRIAKLMRRLMYRHLGWVVVWGCVFGVISGIVTQALKISLNFNFFLS